MRQTRHDVRPDDFDADVSRYCSSVFVVAFAGARGAERGGDEWQR